MITKDGMTLQGVDIIPSEEMERFRGQSKFLQQLAVKSVEMATDGDDYGVISMHADATGFKGGDAGHGGNACVTMECDGTLLNVRLCFNGRYGLQNLRDALDKTAASSNAAAYEVNFEMESGDSLTICAWGDWEQGDFMLGLGRCFVKLARKLGWSSR